MLIKNEKPKTATVVIGISFIAITIIAAMSIQTVGNSLLEFIVNKVAIVLSFIGCAVYFGFLFHSVLTGALADHRKRAKQE